MGIYDREYYREEGGGFRLRGPRTAVGALLLANIAIYVVGQLFFSNSGTDRLAALLAVHVDTLWHPLEWWQFLTYGFAHAAQPEHVIWNMIGLWMFGRDVEQRYGPREFLRVYLVVLVTGSVLWAAANWLTRMPDGSLIGASGAVTAVIVLYAFNFPHRTLLLFFILPIPAWLLGMLLVAGDLAGALGILGGPRVGQGITNIAYSVHLTGAGLAFLYYRFGWNFGRLVPSTFSLAWLKPRPALRVHEPESDADEETVETDLNLEVDRILEKIHRDGEASLTRKERRILENASRQYQRKRQAGQGRT